MSLTTPNDKIILRPKREWLFSKLIYYGKLGLGVLCKNDRVRDKAQRISGYKLNSTKPCQASPYVNVCLIHTSNWTNSAMCNITGLGCPGLCYQLGKGNPSLRLCHLHIKCILESTTEWVWRRCKYFRAEDFSRKFIPGPSSLVRRKYLLRRQRPRPH